MEKNIPTNITIVAKAIFGYMVAMHVLLPVVVFFLYPAPVEEVHGLGLKDMFPNELNQPMYLAILTLGVACFFAGFFVPKLIGRGGAAKVVSAMAGGAIDKSNQGPQSFAPYLIRLVFFETTTLCGFVAAFYFESPQFILPFATFGLLGSVMSPPSENFINSLAK